MKRQFTQEDKDRFLVKLKAATNYLENLNIEQYRAFQLDRNGNLVAAWDDNGLQIKFFPATYD